MNKEKAIELFVKQYYENLISDNWSKSDHNKLKQYFFNEKHRVGGVKDKEICDSLVKVIIQQKKVNDLSELQSQIDCIPLLKLKNIKSIDYELHIKSTRKLRVLSTKLKDVDELQKLEKLSELAAKDHLKFEEKVAEYEISLENERKKREREIQELPSILDEIEFVEPDEIMEISTDKEWWEEINLKSDPFPRLDGIDFISEELYDQIIVETKPIQLILGRLQKDNFTLFHKGYLLAGDYGTGKTTFYDFISPHFTLRGIRPLKINLIEHTTVAEYNRDFAKSVGIEMKKLSKEFNINTPEVIDLQDSWQIMLELQDKGIRGYLLFIDDLHKHTNFELILKFLSQLQIIKNNFTRNNINVFFLISGFPSWRVRIKQDTSLLSFFDDLDEFTMPLITPEIAAKAISKRLRVYSKNPSGSVSVKRAFLKTIFEEEVRKRSGSDNIGFRPYFLKARESLQKKRFDILDVNFMSIDHKLAFEIKSKLEDDYFFHKSLNKLRFGDKGKITDHSFEICLKLFINVFLDRTISEDDELFLKNKMFFKRLSYAGLISRLSGPKPRKWGISKNIRNLNQKIIQEYKLSLENYLIPIYINVPSADVEIKISYKDISQSYIHRFDAIINHIEEFQKSNLKKISKVIEQEILKFTLEPPSRLKSQNLPDIKKLKNIVVTLLMHLIDFESPSLKDVYGANDPRAWQLRYRTLEEVPNFFTIYNQLSSKETVETTDKANLIFHTKNAVDELLDEFEKSIKIYELNSKIKPHQLYKEYNNTLFEFYTNVIHSKTINNKSFDSLEKLVALVEKTIKAYLLISTKLLFGNEDRYKYYPKCIKNIDKPNIMNHLSEDSYNDFELMNRSGFSTLFIKLNKSELFYKYIISPIIEKWDQDDLSTFYRIFADIDQITSHKNYQLINKQIKDFATFVRLSSRLVCCMGDRLVELLISNNTFLKEDSNTYICFGFEQRSKQGKVIFDYSTSQIPAELYKHNITELLQEKGDPINFLNTTNDFDLDLLLVEDVRNRFNTKYNLAFGFLSYNIVFRKIKMIRLYSTNLFVYKTG